MALELKSRGVSRECQNWFGKDSLLDDALIKSSVLRLLVRVSYLNSYALIPIQIPAMPTFATTPHPTSNA